MAANIQLNEGTSGKYAKTTEVSSGVHLGQTQLTNASGTEIATAAVPLQVSLANHGANATGVLVDLSATDNAVLDTIDAVLDTINAKLVTGTVIGDVNLGAVDNAVLDVIAAKDFATQTTLAAVNAKLVSGTVIGDVNLGATDNAVLDTIDAVLDTINAKLVTGTVIGDVNLGATDNAVLDTIAAKDFATQTTLAAINAKLVTGTVIGDVNLGATDNAVLDAMVTDLAALEVLATAIDADTNDIKTAVQLIDNTVGAIAGPGSPVIDSYTHAAINLAAGANQVLVASAANKQIWVYGITFTVNVAGTVSFQDEDDTAITGIMQVGITGGMAISPSGNFAMPIWKLGTDKDLEVDVVTSELDGFLTYAIVSV